MRAPSVAIEEAVRRLDVPVHDAVGVVGSEPPDELEGEVDGARRGEPVLPPQQIGNGPAPDDLHGQKESEVAALGAVEEDGVRVRDLGHQPRLAEGEVEVVAAPFHVQHLERDGASRAGIEGFVDDPHPSAAELSHDSVARDGADERVRLPGGPREVRERAVGFVGRIRHGRAHVDPTGVRCTTGADSGEADCGLINHEDPKTLSRSFLHRALPVILPFNRLGRKAGPGLD